jgi:hypothetical protein
VRIELGRMRVAVLSPKAATVLETLYAGREGSIAAALRAAGYLRVTSAKQAGITDCVWTPEKIARLAD